MNSEPRFESVIESQRMIKRVREIKQTFGIHDNLVEFSHPHQALCDIRVSSITMLIK